MGDGDCIIMRIADRPTIVDNLMQIHKRTLWRQAKVYKDANLSHLLYLWETN